MNPEGSFLDIIAEYLTNEEIQLPVFDESAFRIQQEMAKKDPELKLIQKWVENDPFLNSQVLRVANSTFYKGLSKVTTVRNAIIRLGASEISNIVMLITQRKNFTSKDPFWHDFLNKLWQHSTGCAVGAQWLSKQCHFQEYAHEIFTAGLLHDIGKLLIVKVIEDIHRSEKMDIKPSDALLDEIMNSFHTEHGHSLLKNWNLPEVYCQIAHDHHSEEIDENNILMIMVRLANITCNKLGIGLKEDASLMLAATPEAHLLGLSEVSLAKLEIALEDALELSI
ncbi:MAG: HDOD domain-containing protein [Desulfobacterales bacterium]|nr:MAG: HDOD domain-containing protein [Desulfobacterales bacterium]